MNTSDELQAILHEAVAVAVRALAGVEVVVCDTRVVCGSEGFTDTSARLTVSTHAGEGYFAMSFPDAVGTALTQRILADSGITPDVAITYDCLGEVVNVVAGQAKTMLSGTPAHFTLATPTVAVGAPALAEPQRLLVTFASELGELTLHVRLPA